MNFSFSITPLHTLLISIVVLVLSFLLPKFNKSIKDIIILISLLSIFISLILYFTISPLQTLCISIVIFFVSFFLAKFDKNNRTIEDYVALISFFSIFGSLIWCIFHYLR